MLQDPSEHYFHAVEQNWDSKKYKKCYSIENEKSIISFTWSHRNKHFSHIVKIVKLRFFQAGYLFGVVTKHLETFRNISSSYTQSQTPKNGKLFNVFIVETFLKYQVLILHFHKNKTLKLSNIALFLRVLTWESYLEINFSNL